MPFSVASSFPTIPLLPKFVSDCVGKYEYMPDESWKASGTCTDNIGKDKRYESWEEGSQMKEYPYKITGGTGKYEGVTGAARTFTKIYPIRLRAAHTRAR